jgi:hypothetical protein
MVQYYYTTGSIRKLMMKHKYLIIEAKKKTAQETILSTHIEKKEAK